MDGCCLFACQLPSKELSASCPLYTILRSAFMTQLVYACGFPPYSKKYAKYKILYRIALFPILQYLDVLHGVTETGHLLVDTLQLLFKLRTLLVCVVHHLGDN